MEVFSVSGTIHRSTLRDYLELMKPQTSAMLILPALAALYVAAGIDGPVFSSVLAVFTGGLLAVGGANALNSYLDNESDALMNQTRLRPLPSGRVSNQHALNLGIALNVIAAVILSIFANILSAALAVAGTLYYVFVYTKRVKYRTIHNASFAAIAWAMPVLVGWAAATGGLSLEVLAFFGIILYWAPPYYWSQGIIYRREYKRAGIPLLPVVHGDRPARAQIMAYSVMMFLISLVPVVLGLLYTFYGLAALSLGGLLLIYALYLSKNPGVRPALLLYKYAQIYFLLLFTAMILDRVVF